jgi:hypothetical protein
LKPGDVVEFERVDTGDKVQARVVWHTLVGNEGVRFGAEFVGGDNFWGLNWNEETAKAL